MMSKTVDETPERRRYERLRRTMLLTPGNQKGRLEKAARLDVDAVVFEFEDGVARDDKAQARETVGKALGSLDFGFRWEMCDPQRPSSYA